MDNYQNDDQDKKINTGTGGTKKVDIRKYNDLAGVTMEKLGFGLWWVAHRTKFRNTLIFVLFMTAVFSWAFTFYGYGYYFVKGVEEDKIMVRELVLSKTVDQDFLVARKPVNVMLSAVNILENNNKYDLFIEISNPNEKHVGKFNYCFMSGNKEIECGQDFILPGEQKYILSLSKEFAAKPRAVSFKLNNLTWNRLNLHKYPNWSNFYETHLDIVIKDQEFIEAKSSELSEKLDLNTLNFNISNHSPYSYWEFPLNIVIYKGLKRVAIGEYVLKEFYSSKEQSVKITWPGDFRGVTKFDILPNVDILNSKIYMKQGEIDY